MTTIITTLSIEVPLPAEVVWDWTTDLRNINALGQPWFGFRYDLSAPPWLRRGFVLPTQSLVLGLPVAEAEMRVTDWQPHTRFVDEGWQAGRRLWRHTHIFEAAGGKTRYTDSIEVPRTGWLGAQHAAVALLFRYRQRQLLRHIRWEK